MIVTVEQRIVYENTYITIYDDVVRFPDGHIGTYVRSRWKAPHGVAVVALIGDDVLLIRNFRYSEQGFSVELPQGFGTTGSTPEEDARRELREETGLEVERLEPLFTVGADYKTYVFLGRLAPEALPHHRTQEDTESIAEFVRIPVAALTLGAMQDAGIHDATTMAALLAVRALIEP